MQITSKQIFSIIKDYFVITLGLFIYVCGWVAFIIPNEIVGGGVSGIGALIYYATGGAVGGGFPIQYTYFIVNIVLLLLAVKILGKGFGVKTVYAVLMATLLFSVVPHIIPQNFIMNFKKNGELICAIVGGVCSGAGIGISFTRGGSTGGTDIVALMINKYREVSPGRLIMLIDVIIIGSSYVLFQDITKIVYGYIMVGVTGYTIDMILSGAKQSVQIMVFSKNYAQIADRITRDLRRGVTAMDSVGWYTKEHNTVLLIVARKYEASDVYRVIKEEDRDAFISVASIMGVYGKGFEQFKKK